MEFAAHNLTNLKEITLKCDLEKALFFLIMFNKRKQKL